MDKEFEKVGKIEDEVRAQEDIDIDNDDDKTLADKLEWRLKETKQLHNQIVKQAQENMEIFEGNLEKVAGTKLQKSNSETVINRFFLTIRNLVGLDTDNMPQVDIAPSKDTPPSVDKAEKIKSNLEYGMVRTNFLGLITECLLDTRIKRDSFLHWFYDYEKDDFDTIGVSIEDLSFSIDASGVQDAEYLFYHPVKNRSWWKNYFPNQYKDIQFQNFTPEELKQKGLSGSKQEVSGRGNVGRLFDFWENEINIKAARGKDGLFIILDKKRNPYFEWRDPYMQFEEHVASTNPEAMQVAKMSQIPLDKIMPKEAQAFKPISNFLDKPRKPFVQIPSLKLMGRLYSTDLIQQGKQAFISYVAKKRQVADNLRGCNKKIIVDSNSFSEEEAAAITDEPLQVLRADMSVNANPVQIIETSNPELAGIMLDMQDDEKYFDDLFGQHEVSRGSASANTLGQDQMNRESDKTPVRMQSRFVESAIKEMFEGWIQIMKMFYTETHYAKKFGAKEGIEMVEIMQDDVEEGIEPLIKPGSMVRVDKFARAIQLFQSKAIDPYTLFVELEVPQPLEKAYRLINWMKFGVLSDQDPAEVEADLMDNTNTAGDSTENPIERADQENRAFQSGDDVPPTPPELVTKEHIKLHYDFLKDPKKKMEQEDMDRLTAHAEVDKATFKEVMVSGAADQANAEINKEREAKQPKGKKNEGKKPVVKNKGGSK